MNIGNVKFRKLKRSENLDAKKWARIDKMRYTILKNERLSKDKLSHC